jgi:hypothetical protein
MLLFMSPIAFAATTTSSLKFQLSPSEGGIGTEVMIGGNITLTAPIAGKDNVSVYFGSASSPVAEIRVPFDNKSYASFNATFDVPVVNHGEYDVSVIDSYGGHSSQTFNVTYGFDTLIDKLNSIQTLISTNSASAGIANQLHSLNQTVSSLENSISSLIQTSSNSNATNQSESLLLIFAVVLESVIVVMVALLIILQIRREGGRKSKLEELEVFQS